MYFGNVCPSVPAPLSRPALCRTRPLLPFQLLPGFPEMDLGHRAALGLKRKPSSCGVCRLGFNSQVQALSHYSGTKHAKRLKSVDGPESASRTPDPVATETAAPTAPSPCSLLPGSDTASAEASALLHPPTETVTAPAEAAMCPRPETTHTETSGEKEEEETEEEKAKRLLYCSLCKVAVNSASQLQAHNSGTKHKTMLDARSGGGAIKSFPRSGVKSKMAAPPESSTGLQNKTFHCEICDVHVNSETQLKQHISSRRHKDRAAGKPAKPKFSPYSPTQRPHGLQAIRLAVQKNPDLTQAPTSSLLQRQLSIAAAMAALSPFPLGPVTNTSPALFQSQPLPQTLLHPAAGPICPTHSPVLFSPY